MAFTNRNVCKNFAEDIDASSWTELNANGANNKNKAEISIMRGAIKSP